MWRLQHCNRQGALFRFESTLEYYKASSHLVHTNIHPIPYEYPPDKCAHFSDVGRFADVPDKTPHQGEITINNKTTNRESEPSELFHTRPKPRGERPKLRQPNPQDPANHTDIRHTTNNNTNRTTPGRPASQHQQQQSKPKPNQNTKNNKPTTPKPRAERAKTASATTCPRGLFSFQSGNWITSDSSTSSFPRFFQ